LAAVGQVMAPRVSAFYASGDRTEIERLLARGTRAASALALPPALLLILVGPWFLGLFGHGFREGSTALTVLVLGQLFNAATGAVGMVLVMTRHERSAIVATLSGTCLNITLCALLIPGWGPTGAATAAAVSMVLINALFMVALVEKLRIRPTIFGIRLPGVA
jgi:O-antigen/teichoic acid export membrane protein